MTTYRTQVAIIGSGPSGLLLGQLLTRAGIDNIILDRASKERILSRIRAGVLESGTTRMMDQAGVGTRMHAEGLLHNGFELAFSGRSERIDMKKLARQGVMVYGQTEVTKDLMDARQASGAPSLYEVEGVSPAEFDTDNPHVDLRLDGEDARINCDFIAGCDGYHGASRKAVPESAITQYEKEYPFGWLGILAEVPPVRNELIYANHQRGFALCSMRSTTRSRYYIQCSTEDRIENWSDDAFWDELRRRLPQDVAQSMVTGPSIEKSIAPLRSFVAEPMRFGSLFLAGDAAHIVPPTGAKGLNLAISDVHYLFEGLRDFYFDGSRTRLNAYSHRALTRVWNAVRFSWWFTTCMHRFPETDAFNQRIQEAELDYLSQSNSAQTSLAENYVGLPY